MTNISDDHGPEALLAYLKKQAEEAKRAEGYWNNRLRYDSTNHGYRREQQAARAAYERFRAWHDVAHGFCSGHAERLSKAHCRAVLGAAESLEVLRGKLELEIRSFRQMLEEQT